MVNSLQLVITQSSNILFIFIKINFLVKDEFPYLASLRYAKHNFCSATIISSKHLLSAAHCMYNQTNADMIDPSHITIVVGSSFNIVNDISPSYEVSKIFIHRDFVVIDNLYVDNDIAIIRVIELL